jgi:hypothetical protein
MMPEIKLLFICRLQICLYVNLTRRQYALAAVDLNSLVFTGAHNAHLTIPAHAKDFDTLTSHALAVRLALFLQALP